MSPYSIPVHTRPVIVGLMLAILAAAGLAGPARADHAPLAAPLAAPEVRPLAVSPPAESGATAAGAVSMAGYEIFAREIDGGYVCSRALVQRSPGQCPPLGPGAREVRIAYLRRRLPDPLPALPVTMLPRPEGGVTHYLYGQIVDYPAPTYRHPAEAEAGLPPVRVFLSNINWVSVVGEVTYNGRAWVQINGDEVIAAEHITFPEPSRFQGIQLTETPGLPFAWLRRDLQPSPLPGAPPSGEILPLRSLVTIFAIETVGDTRWLMVGPDQWIDYGYVAMVTPRAAPEGVPAGAKWIDVDTYEQTLAAYAGDRMVYATLITAGKSDLTPLGLFRIFRKLTAALMESYDRPMDDEYWYYLEDVEDAQFFNERISLHAAYWHDYFGNQHSNGCVNLAPLDAAWLYDWTDPQLAPGASWATAEAAGEGQTWVWVHSAGPEGAHKP